MVSMRAYCAFDLKPHPSGRESQIDAVCGPFPFSGVATDAVCEFRPLPARRCYRKCASPEPPHQSEKLLGDAGTGWVWWFPDCVAQNLSENCGRKSQLVRHCDALCLSRSQTLKINGVALENGSIVLSQGRTDVQVFEPVSNEFALVSTPLSLETLELSAMADKTIVRASERVALDNLRSTIIKAVQFASSNPNAASQRSVEAGMQQSLSLAIERVLSGNATATWDTTLASRRHAQLVSGVDEYLRLNPEAAIYSEDLARLLGVSVSTLKSSVLAIRGMSIHRYLRLRRLWSVRRQLMNGVPGLTIKQSALANGFWHMGEFSSLIRRHLENPPR